MRSLQGINLFKEADTFFLLLEKFEILLSLLKCISKTELGAAIQSSYEQHYTLSIFSSKKNHMSFYTDTDLLEMFLTQKHQFSCLRTGIY